MSDMQCLLMNVPGGDDLKMKGWDIRQGGPSPLFVNKRYVLLESHRCSVLNFYRFDAGITTIQSHPHIEHILAVGRCTSDSLNLFQAVVRTHDINHQLQQHGSHLRHAQAARAAHRN